MPTTYDPKNDPIRRAQETFAMEAATSGVLPNRPEVSAPYNPNRDTVDGVATVSPTGAPVIPPRAVPFLLLGAGLAQVIGDEVSNPAPWTLSRGIGLAVKVLSFLALGASPGLRRR